MHHLRHVVKVHSVNAYNKSQWHEESRKYRHDLHDIICALSGQGEIHIHQVIDVADYLVVFVQHLHMQVLNVLKERIVPLTLPDTVYDVCCKN